MTFPAHWFGVSRIGTQVVFGMVPATCMVTATQWRLYPEGLRVSDMGNIVASLKSEPQGVMLILAVVETVGEAVYLMEAARICLRAWDDEVCAAHFAAPITPPPKTGPTVPSEPLPPGHPDSYSMDDLRADLQLSKDAGHSPTVAGRFDVDQAPITDYCNAPLSSPGGAGVHLCVYEHGHVGPHSWGGP